MRWHRHDGPVPVIHEDVIGHQIEFFLIERIDGIAMVTRHVFSIAQSFLFPGFCLLLDQVLHLA